HSIFDVSLHIEQHPRSSLNGFWRHANGPHPACIKLFWLLRLTPSPAVTRSHKYNDRDHAALADGTASPQEHLPRYFAKHGHEGVDPKKVKKNGGGRSNWGNAGEEVVDEDFRFTNARRRTNSSGYADNLSAFKTKFDVNEPEPVFEESIHGPNEEDGEDLTKTETSESGGSSYGDEKITKH
ncbi:hypothetical protein GCG54_00011367, partial [Colletotrichum gloeosporioides]